MSGARERRLKIFLVGTEFFRGHGGIQYVNRMLVRAFQEMGRTTPIEMDAFSFTDGPEHLPVQGNDRPDVRWHGARHSRPGMVWQLTRRLGEARPDLVLFTHVSLLPLEDLVRAFAPGARVAALAHGAEVWHPLPKATARALRRAPSFVCPSEFTARKLVEVQGVPAEHITVIPHGLDADWAARCDAEPGATPSRTGHSLLSVTRLSRADTSGKGVEQVLRALPVLAEHFPEMRYRIAGGGEDLPRMAELARQLGVEARVEFLGAVDDEALRRAYADADIFVLPTKVEGFGIVFLEAMYNRLPVVAVRASATTEVVEDEVTGLLVSPDDPAPLAAAVEELMLSGERRRALGEAGRRRVQRMYLFEHFAARWERWLAAQVPVALYTARQATAFALARAAAGTF
jgi:glycosyltransferase involved in cell wall biosynthesis